MRRLPSKIISILLFISACLLCFSCGNESESKQPSEHITYYTLQYYASEGGQIQGNAAQLAEQGSDGEEVTAKPNDGYVFTEWSDGKITSTRKDTNVCKDIDVTANFAKVLLVEYTESTGGHVQGDKTQSVIYGNDASTVTAVPDTGYFFLKWSDGVTDNPRRDKNIFDSLTVEAKFSRIAFTVEYRKSEGGDVHNFVKQSVYYGENSEPGTAVPNPGHEFIGWSDGFTDATRSDVNITSDLVVTALFEKQKFTVNYVAGTGGHILGEQIQSVPYLEASSTVTAVADDGYQFIGWSDGITNTERFDGNITSDIKITALFEKVATFAGGTGTLTNPYLIGTYEQLLNMKQHPNSAYKLIRDLDLHGIDHKPIFDQNIQCQAFLDGDGHTISNMTVDSDHAFPSLFGVIGDSSRITNLNVTDAKIILHDLAESSLRLRAGILCGISFGRLEHITVSGVIQGNNLEKDGVFIGGLAAQTLYRITDCHSDVTIALNDIDVGSGDMALCVGGLVGVAANSFFNCSAISNISVTSRTDSEKEIRNAAGLVSHFAFDKRAESLMVKNCHSITDISINPIGYRESGVCAGLINQISNVMSVCISDCSAKGTLSAVFVSGFIKLISATNVSITKSSFDGNINCRNIAAGFIYQLSVPRDGIASIENCFSRGTISANRYGCGFFYMILKSKVTISKCYSDMDVTARDAFGFGYIFAGTSIKQCYTCGELTARNYAAGLIKAAADSIITDCYSCCNITINNPKEDLYVGGLMVTVGYSTVSNCYFGGTIQCKGSSQSELGAIIAILGTDTIVNNCHWLNIQTDGYIVFTDFGRYHDTATTNSYGYDSLKKMKYPDTTRTLADILNGAYRDSIWIQTENELPTLKFN